MALFLFKVFDVYVRWGKVVSILRNFQVTVQCSFACPCSSSQFCMLNMSGKMSNHVFNVDKIIQRSSFWYTFGL